MKTLGGRKLGRTGQHRKALLNNLATSLFLHERVETSISKAKELRPYAEKLITAAKKGDHHVVRKSVHNKLVYKKLFDVIAPRYQNRPGGYTQIFRTKVQIGDNTQQGLIRLVS